MPTFLLCLISFFLFLLWERLALHRAQRRIPLRIAVTGTRGKSSVVRLLASVLKEGGRTVIAKTTGSQAVILLPDGGQIELDRSVPPSILEQKQLIHRAVRLKADCLVSEVMSLRPENHYVESHFLLRPNLVAITNVRRDHTEVMGETEAQIASVLSLDICRRSQVFLPAREDCASFRAEALRCDAALMPVESGSSARFLQDAPDLSRIEFSDNLDLVCAIAGHLGLDQQDIIAGIRNAKHDIGQLRLWRYHPASSDHTLFLVNAFAANDPESTLQVLAKVTDMLPASSGHIVGVFNLRADRLPRTMQWISVMREGALGHFRRLYLVGDHTRAIRRRLPEAHALKTGSPEQITNIICSEATDPAIVFGFGNIKGPGKLLAEYWSRVGVPYA
jgi:poly-gamma-glutamate synthase PgsB/CapB